MSTVQLNQRETFSAIHYWGIWGEFFIFKWKSKAKNTFIFFFSPDKCFCRSWDSVKHFIFWILSGSSFGNGDRVGTGRCAVGTGCSRASPLVPAGSTSCRLHRLHSPFWLILVVFFFALKCLEQQEALSNQWRKGFGEARAGGIIFGSGWRRRLLHAKQRHCWGGEQREMTLGKEDSEEKLMEKIGKESS